MGARVLLVEDEIDVLDVAADYLAALGYRVHACASGEEAIAAVAAAPFDVAVVDWTLPDMPFRELLAVVRAHAPACVVLVSTGHGRDLVGGEPGDPAIGGVIRKPYTMRSLAMRIEALLER